MLGQTIISRRRAPVGSVIWLLFGLACLAAAYVERSPHWAIAAFAPLSLAFFFWIGRGCQVAFTVEDRALVPLSGNPPIPYNSIQRLSMGGRVAVGDENDSTHCAAGPIVIEHAAGQLTLPATLRSSGGAVEPAEKLTLDLFHFLRERVAAQPERLPPDKLVDYFRQQQEKFGRDKVVVVQQRPDDSRCLPTRKVCSVARAMFVVGCLWIAAAVISRLLGVEDRDDRYAAWAGGGMFAWLVAGLCWLPGQSLSDRHFRKSRKTGPAGIVIGPAGMAMTQQDLQGELTWEEVKHLKLTRGAPTLGRREDVLNIGFAGGKVMVVDVYDKPVGQIAELIARNTRLPVA